LKVIEIKARLRKRLDKDIHIAMDRLHLEDDEIMSDLVREGFRKELRDRGVMYTVDDIETAIERSEK